MKKSLPAYAGIAPPDFFPGISQREMMTWWREQAPEPIRGGVWCIDPLALSDIRIAANVTLPAGFDINDDTMTAIVGPPVGKAETRPSPANEVAVFTRLPDGSNGVFDPGWDFSQDTNIAGRLYLANYGLGTPFIEDAKLCAALGSYWPAVAPDSTRTFQPLKKPQGGDWPWPTINPLTDEEIGSAEVAGGGYLPWDGVRGPELVTHEGKRMVRYLNIANVDYIDLAGKMTAFLTAKIDLKEYEGRTVAMAAAYWALSIRDDRYLDPKNWKVGVKHENILANEGELMRNRMQLAKSGWAVASFRKVPGDDAEYRQACTQVGLTPAEDPYRLLIYCWGKQQPDPTDFRRVLVEMKETALFYVDDKQLLVQRNDSPWEKQALFATS